jgi:hypothetical protein
MAKNDLPNVAKAASNLNQYAIRLTPAVTQINPNAQQTTALLQAITGQADTVTLFGDTGADQQRSAVYALYTGLATSPNKPADADAVIGLILDGLYPPQGKTAVDPAAYQKALALLSLVALTAWLSGRRALEAAAAALRRKRA